MKVLIIEDDANIADVITTAFDLGWPEVYISQSPNGKKGVELVESETPDVVILDLGLPDINGFEVLNQIRLFSEVPILILTVRNDEASIVKGLSLGADDYLTKPFRQMELLARVRAITRRYQNGENVQSVEVGDWSLGNSLNEVHHGDEKFTLTCTEGLLLFTLMKNAGKCVSYGVLSRQIWNRRHLEVADALRVYIRRVREKIGDDQKTPKIVINKPRQGYMFVVPDKHV